jgi:hypothetical protein
VAVGGSVGRGVGVGGGLVAVNVIVGDGVRLALEALQANADRNKSAIMRRFRDSDIKVSPADADFLELWSIV